MRPVAHAAANCRCAVPPVVGTGGRRLLAQGGSMEPQEPVVVQGVAFAVAALTGVLAGAVTDGYRALIRTCHPPRAVLQALDVLFVVLLLPVVAAGWLVANWGALRVYPLAAWLFGFVLYLAFGSPVVLPTLCWLVATIFGLAHRIWRLAAWPMRHLRPWAIRLARAVGLRYRVRDGAAGTDSRPPSSGSE